MPRWGATELGAISGMKVNAWAKHLRSTGYADSTVTTIVKVLTMMLADAVDERLIPVNPIRPQRRGRRHHQVVTEAVWESPEQAVRVALNAARLDGSMAGMLVLTAAWTGARWGELTGLHRDNLHLPALPQHGPGRLRIDPKVGALHEVDAALFLGPPKTAESAREIQLPPFLVELLHHHCDSHRHGQVFVVRDGSPLRRSNFSRRAMRPAADGTTHRPGAAVQVPAVAPGLTFHGLRHGHKTWMIADLVAPELEARVLQTLQQRWITALAALATPDWATAVATRPALPAQAS